MAIEDTILIKIGKSYREGMSAEELYNATSVSWKISGNKLQSGDYKYYCAIYNNKIIEVYELMGYEKDGRPELEGRFILKGKIADMQIRNALLGHDVSDLHKGLGNPIKYANMEILLKKVDKDYIKKEGSVKGSLEGSRIKHLLINLAKQVKVIKTLRTQKSNWITKIDEKGIFVETESSREKHQKGEKEFPWDYLSFEYIMEGWREFLEVRTATATDFRSVQGRSSFLMAFFSQLPFVEVTTKNNKVAITLKEFTTDQLPEGNFELTLTFLEEIIEGNIDPRKINSLYKEESIKRLKSRARQGLKLLGFLTDNYDINKSLINEYQAEVNRKNLLRNQLSKLDYINIIRSLLPLIGNLQKQDKLICLKEIGMLIVRNSLKENLMKETVAEYRSRNILSWLQELEIVDGEWNLINKEIKNEYIINSGVSIAQEEVSKLLSTNEVVTHIDNYIKSKGFYYEKEDVINLFISLKTKPFVILSGISGTGKTKIVQWFSESIGANESNGQFKLIPVRPDWSDGSDLLGYRDIKGDFVEGPLTKIIKRAADNPSLPYFVLLDEMNLARVEYYFSDILSVMESRRWENGEIVTSILLSDEIAEKNISLPTNLYLIGTVNMDETTHPFSKKVLDRANTIEFNEVNLGYLDFLHDLPEVLPINIDNQTLKGSYLHLKDVYVEDPNLVEKTTTELVKINELLKPIGAQVGYRVRDEICFYIAYNEAADLYSFDQALDRCILQKILPRVAGSDNRVEEVLNSLYTYCTNRSFNEDGLLNFNELKNVKYPKSAKKVIEMRRRLEDGFTSFWIGS
ncbi:AAA family ATPase [Fredinandcohnia onubensis]|uniref:AAA family ATPase n=1 Tax=Fredinandcohnia onubensis TaxID=1571209 RepID=UPI003CCB9E6A